MLSEDMSNMCREALIVFAGHFLISAFTMADAGVHVGYLCGKNKSSYTKAYEKDDLHDVKYVMSYLDKSNRASKEYHDSFMDTLRWEIPTVKEILQRAVSNKALREHEWIDLLKWWFDVAQEELKVVIE